MDQIDKKSA